jgi:excisionase family DNA binding protein
MTKLLTIDEAAKVMGLGKTRLYEELNACRLRGLKSGRKTLIPADAIDEWISTLTAYAPNQNAA